MTPKIPNFDKQLRQSMLYATDVEAFADQVVHHPLEWFHKEWIDAADNNKRVAILAPTGFGKSFTLAVTYPLWKAYQQKFDVLIVSNSMRQSTGVLQTIKDTINNSDELTDMKPESREESWSRTEITLAHNGSRFFCKPYSKNIKGCHVDYVLCVPGDTLIDTETGDKKIKNIKIGDMVRTHTGELKPVTKVYKRENRSYKLIRFTGPGYSLEITPDHPIYTDAVSPAHRFTPAGDIQLDDRLVSFNDDYSTIEFHDIDKIDYYKKMTELYNLEVRDDNSYIANGIIVHNCDEAASYADIDIYDRYVVTRANAKNGTVAAISTLESEVDLMSRLFKRDSYWSKKYTALVDGESIWPDKFSTERLLQMQQETPQAFKREYMCEPTAVSDGVFPPNIVIDCFDDSIGFQEPETNYWECTECDRRYDEHQDSCDGPKGLGPCSGDIVRRVNFVFFGIDFALSSHRKADYTVITVVESMDNKLYLRDMYRFKGLSVEAHRNKIKSLYEKYQPKRIFLDESGMGQTFLQDLRQDGLPVKGCAFAPKQRTMYLNSLMRALDSGKLVIPRKESDRRAMTLTKILYKELTAFRLTETPAGARTYKTTAAHDDCVMSIALAVHGASVQKPATLGMAH